jgi:hypothetical protein
MKHERRYNEHDRPDVLREKGSQLRDDLVLDEIDNLNQCREDGVILKGGTFESYAEGHENIHVHGCALIERSHLVVSNLCFAFNAVRRLQVDPLKIDARDQGGASINKIDKKKIVPAMLIDVTQLAQVPEGMNRRFAASVVRLQALDHCLGAWRDAPDFARGALDIPLVVYEDWKFRGLRHIRWEGIAGVSDSQGIS